MRRRKNPNKAPDHVSPELFDLPPGEWMCRACAMDALACSRSRMAELVEAHSIFSVARARRWDTPGHSHNFYAKGDVMRAALLRREEREHKNPTLRASGWMPTLRITDVDSDRIRDLLTERISRSQVYGGAARRGRNP